MKELRFLNDQEALHFSLCGQLIIDSHYGSYLAAAPLCLET